MIFAFSLEMNLLKLFELHRLGHVTSKPVVMGWDQVRHKPDCTTQKMARGLKFQIFEIEGLYCLCGKSKDADRFSRHTAELFLIH